MDSIIVKFLCLSAELSFWRHPFTADDQLVFKWCIATFLQICSDEETNVSTHVVWPEGELILSVSIYLEEGDSWPGEKKKRNVSNERSDFHKKQQLFPFYDTAMLLLRAILQNDTYYKHKHKYMHIDQAMTPANDAFSQAYVMYVYVIQRVILSDIQ